MGSDALLELDPNDRAFLNLPRRDCFLVSTTGSSGTGEGDGTGEGKGALVGALGEAFSSLTAAMDPAGGLDWPYDCCCCCRCCCSVEPELELESTGRDAEVELEVDCEG